MSTTAMLTDEQWARIEPLLPPLKGPMGKPFLPRRPVVEGCIYRLKGGLPWRMLPPQFGAWQTVHRRHHRWSQDGTWDRILAALQEQAETAGEIDWQLSVDSKISRARPLRGARRGRRPTQGAGSNYNDRSLREDEPDDHGIGRSRGGLTSKTHALVDGRGRLLVCIVSPGQAGDSAVLPKLLAELRVNSRRPGRPRTTPVSLRGDKAYSLRPRGLARVRRLAAGAGAGFGCTNPIRLLSREVNGGTDVVGIFLNTDALRASRPACRSKPTTSGRTATGPT